MAALLIVLLRLLVMGSPFRFVKVVVTSATFCRRVEDGVSALTKPPARVEERGGNVWHRVISYSVTSRGRKHPAGTQKCGANKLVHAAFDIGRLCISG